MSRSDTVVSLQLTYSLPITGDFKASPMFKSRLAAFKIIEREIHCGQIERLIFF